MFDDLAAAITGPTILGYLPANTTHTEFHTRLRNALLKDPSSADVIGPRLARALTAWYPGMPEHVSHDAARSHMRIALRRKDLGPAPEPADCLCEAAPEPRGGRKARLVASARLVLDAERRRVAELKLADDARREAACRELQARYARDRLNIPKRPRGGW